MPDNPILTKKDRALFRRAVAGAIADKADAACRDAGASPKPSQPDDQTLFQQAMTGVKPLPVDCMPPYRRRLPALPLSHNGHLTESASGSSALDEYESAFDDPDAVVAEHLWFARPGLQHTLLRKLRQGRLEIGAELDLHGMFVAEARHAVEVFILEARERGIRCVRIIHGKGNWSIDRHPVLKAKVDHWLRHWQDEVLAFSSARPEDGGSGAVYVLLRRGD